MLENKRAVAIRMIWLTIAVLIIFMPLLWILLSSFKSVADLAQPSKLLFMPTLDNWGKVFSSDLVPAVGRSLVIGLSAVGISLLVGVPAAYSISRYGTGGSGINLILIIAQVVPPAVLVFPFLRLSRLIGTNGSLLSLLPAHISFVLPVIVWLFIGFFADIPVSVEEAARIDGETRWSAFAKVVLPQVKTGIGAAAIFGFSLSWNDMFYSLILVSGKMETLPLAIAGFNTFRGIDLGTMSAAVVLSSLPMIILVFFIQKYLIQGLSGTGVKY
jgi:ABC-type glycerol-3-phosphate transport system permease component